MNKSEIRKFREIGFVEKLVNSFEKILSFLFPIASKILNSKQDEYKIIRSMLALVCGSFYTITIFYLTLYRIEGLSDSVKLSLFVILLVITSIGMVLFVQLRCVITLSVFNFISRAGRVMLTSYILINMLNGPIENTFKNIEELERSIVCQYRLMGSLSKLASKNLNSENGVYHEVLQSDKEIAMQEKEIDYMLSTLNNENLTPLNKDDRSGKFSQHSYLKQGILIKDFERKVFYIFFIKNFLN